MVMIFTDNLLETFEHYKKAFNAKNIGEGYSDNKELIHLEMNILGNKIALAPHSPNEIIRENVTVICLKFQQKEALIKAYNALKEEGQTEGLKELPWSPLEGYVTDKYSVVWCIGI
ncbi:MAG: hypothetical protein LBH43_14250 [Treponema sp.]|jgi:uncharacterized glyoxalase superfamily protein PhnB|nr:hypothetical protein [Treponema sp.]